MTRFSAAAAGFVAAVAWLVTSTGCEASLVEGRSFRSALASMTLVEQADRTNLRSSTSSISSSSSSSAAAAATKRSKEDRDDFTVENDRVTRRMMLQERTRTVKSLTGSARTSKRMTKDRTATAADWARQLGMSKKDVDQILKAHNAKEANMAASSRFLSKSQSKNEDPETKRKLFQYSKAAAKTASSSSSSFLDAMIHSSSSSSSSHLSVSSATNNNHINQRGLLRKTQEAVALGACTTAANDVGQYRGVSCTCSEDPNAAGGYIMDCIDPCTSCSDVDTMTICAKLSAQIYFAADTGANTTKSQTYNYSTGKDETVMVLETGCAIDSFGFGNCTGCVASVDGTPCNSCSPETCWDYGYSYPSYTIDCTNAGSLAAYTFCEFPTIPVADPLYALGGLGSYYCENLGKAPCEAEKAIREAELDSLYCQCLDSYEYSYEYSYSNYGMGVELKCSDTCGLFCNDGGDQCGRSSSSTVFSSSDGTILYQKEVFEYSDNRRYELQVLESMENCTFTDKDYNACGCSIQTCADGTEAPKVDCTPSGGQVLDLCQSEPAVGGTMFEYRSYDNCIDSSPENDACSDSGATLVLGGSMISGSLTNAMYYHAESCSYSYSASDDVGLWYKFVGTNTGIKVSTCGENTNTNTTNFGTQVSVYSGSCDALQCLAVMNDWACGSGAALFFGAQDVTYHVRVHGYGDQKGDFVLTIEEANIALETCEGMTMYMNDPYSGAVCECSESGQDAVMTCQDECSYCSADKSVCATKKTVSTIKTSSNAAVTAKSATYTYTQGQEGILVFDTTGCDMEDGSCSACSVTFNGVQCNTCTPSQCGGGYASFDIDCANVDPNAVISLCDFPTIASGPLQVLSNDGFATCVRDPLEACNSLKAYQTEYYLYSCECTGSDATATLTCSDPNCPMSCNLDYTVCWNDSLATIFDADGQQSSSVEINTYTQGRDEVVTWEGRGYDVCTIKVNGEACNSCGPVTCSDDGSTVQAVDCENIQVGASFDSCGDYAVDGQTGVLQAFNDYEVNSCLILSDPQALCQAEVDYYSLWGGGTTCECAPDPITGTDYILTCEGSCLSCNSENTVCANQSSMTTINKYGRYHSSARSYTYMSGEGRDETVVLTGVDYGVEDCSITVNGNPCNSCGTITCTDESGYVYDGKAVDCENIEAGASYDSCDNYGSWVVDTGVLEVLSSYEFGMYCSNTGAVGNATVQEEEVNQSSSSSTTNNSNNG